MSNLVSLKGRRFGRLVVQHRGETSCGNARWWCRCDCGAYAEVFAQALRSGATRSCGCLRRELSRQRRLDVGRRNKESQPGQVAQQTEGTSA